MVFSGCGVDTGGFGWSLVLMVGYGVVTGGYRWLQIAMSGFGLLWEAL